MSRVQIPIIDDAIAEGRELFRVFLTSTNPGVIVTQDRATVEIIDTDGKLCTKGDSIVQC